jgi:guanine deaminase
MTSLVGILTQIINPLSDTKCDYIKSGAVVVKYSLSKQVQAHMVAVGSAQDLKKKYPHVVWIDQSDHVMLPSFFDMHFHWVQDDVREMPKDSLLDWLNNYTFPTENKFKNKKFADRRAREFFANIFKFGTTGGACYSSVHGHALECAQKYAKGDFTIGNVLMDMNSPKFLQQSSKNAIELVDKFSKKYKHKYAVTPRFAPTTSPKVMAASAKLAKQNGSYIQTHLSENLAEIDWVTSMYKSIKGFESIDSYTEIYHRCNLLSPKTFMGHAIHLLPSEIKLLKKTKTVLVHCPTSNAPIKELGLGSGLFNYELIEKNGIEWCMGSDIGGGPSLSMFDVMESFVRQHKKARVKSATYIKALYRSTLKSAHLMNCAKDAGNLAVGKYANFILVKAPKGNKINKAEDVLKALLSQRWKHREDYASLVEATIYRGEVCYLKNANSLLNILPQVKLT